MLFYPTRKTNYKHIAVKNMMKLFIDLRFFFPPFINLILVLLTSPQGGALSVLVNASIFQFDQYPIWKLASLFLLILLLLLFLLTSIKLHLSAHPITIRAGYFSGPLALSLLASIFLQLPLFWFAYFIIIITFPWHGMLWDLVKCFVNRFVLCLKSIPTLVISCAQQLAHNPEAAQPPESVDIEVGGNPMQNLSSLE